MADNQHHQSAIKRERSPSDPGAVDDAPPPTKKAALTKYPRYHITAINPIAPVIFPSVVPVIVPVVVPVVVKAIVLALIFSSSCTRADFGRLRNCYLQSHRQHHGQSASCLWSRPRTAVPTGGMNATAPGTRITAPSATVSRYEVTMVLGSSGRDLVSRTPR
ncbi:uncharacterized protein DFL_000302 [Arthrobotrys flagrans]|uniref:Uncharacterized protein n=1 Tax=Arthrobotrys flagrans TaxID=97331 RepID=A0A437ADR0_ARTFL|nr:hypothetical protein DFL_000302 [Arthrobotrys flagrans]